MSKKKGTRNSRRDFLKIVGASTAALSVPGLALPGLPGANVNPPQDAELAASAKHEHLQSRSHSVRVQDIPYPRSFTGRQLARISFPLGGIGTGGIGPTLETLLATHFRQSG